MQQSVSSRQTRWGLWFGSSAGRMYKCGLLLLAISACWAGAQAFAEVGNANPMPAAHQELKQQLHNIDDENPGKLGVYIKRLHNNQTVDFDAQRRWYLASLVKVPLAVAVLQAVEAKQLALDDQLVLQKTDFVDGSGDMLFQEAGSRHSIGNLLQKSLVDSDSTATDMLMRRLGVDRFNQQIKTAMVAQGLGPFTTILQVRYDAYQELHPQATRLSNMDYVQLRSAGGFDQRVQAFAKLLAIDAGNLKADSLEQAFQRYYSRDLNHGTLQAAGQLLERLVKQQLLTAEHTQLLLEHMQSITTGDKRLAAGLPDNVVFAQKTGTQIERACNMGVLHPDTPEQTVIIVACTEEFGDIANAERAFKQVGQALQATGWLANRSGGNGQ